AFCWVEPIGSPSTMRRFLCAVDVRAPCAALLFRQCFASRSPCEEAKMNDGTSARRDVLKRMAAAGAVALPAALGRSPAEAAGPPAYDPSARFDLVVSEVELRRNVAGRMLMARIYQPKGTGPFPTVLDLHGGAWNRKDRFAEEPMDRALAASGLL